MLFPVSHLALTELFYIAHPQVPCPSNSVMKSSLTSFWDVHMHVICGIAVSFLWLCQNNWHSLMKERPVLAHSLRDFSPWSPLTSSQQKCCHRTLSSPRKQGQVDNSFFLPFEWNQLEPVSGLESVLSLVIYYWVPESKGGDLYLCVIIVEGPVVILWEKSPQDPQLPLSTNAAS